MEIQPSPSPTLSQSRVALREEEECQQLSPPEPKKVTDYVSGLFRLDIRTQRPSSRLALSPQPPDSPPANEGAERDGEAVVPATDCVLLLWLLAVTDVVAGGEFDPAVADVLRGIGRLED
ncbi:hypothetical protein B566_EDAN008819 [Ephemera danica]|nr:hypothetical protein B566_EDAN008819 [Ephemera danica]